MQTRDGSGLPGNGVVEQSANAQSLAATVVDAVFTPSAVSRVMARSFAFAESSETGGYGDGWSRGIRSSTVLRAGFACRSVKRNTNGPVMLVPSVFLATGT